MTEKNKTQAEGAEALAEKEKKTAKSKIEKIEKIDPVLDEAVIDIIKTEPNPKVEKENMATAQNVATNNTKEKKSGFGLSILAISMVIALGGVGYHFGLLESNKVNAEIENLKREIATLNSSLQQSNANIQSVSVAAKEERDRLQILINQQDNSLSSMQTALVELKGRRPNDWLLAEADHLIKQAARQLWIEKDINTASRLVETADQRIAQLNDPSLLPIRQALANDIQTLKAVVPVDSDGIALRITTLQNQVNSLVLANALLSEEIEQLAPKAVSEEISNWKENLMTSMKDFADQFITYRKREGTVVPLLTPAQTFYLQENIKAKLAQAINSVYRENTELYLTSLATAKQWINDFYHLEMPETQAFIAAIDELEALTIKVNYPEKLTSLSLISDEMAQRLSEELSALVRNDVSNSPVEANTEISIEVNNEVNQ